MARKPHIMFDSEGNEVDEHGNRIKRRRTLGDRSPELPNRHARFGVAKSTLVTAEPGRAPKPETVEDKKRLAKYRRARSKIFRRS